MEELITWKKFLSIRSVVKSVEMSSKVCTAMISSSANAVRWQSTEEKITCAAAETVKTGRSWANTQIYNDTQTTPIDFNISTSVVLLSPVLKKTAKMLEYCTRKFGTPLFENTPPWRYSHIFVTRKQLMIPMLLLNLYYQRCSVFRTEKRYSFSGTALKQSAPL